MKRRKFIDNTLIGTSGLLLGASGLMTSSCRGANDKVVLALIGSGARGTDTIISTSKVNENVEIKTVCDVNDLKASRAIAAIEKELGYKPQHSRNMQEVFDDKDIDAAWIATPEHWHALATVWACQAGKDVYVEKNPSTNVWEGRKMVEAARKYKRIVQVGCQTRSAPYVEHAVNYVQSGKLGDIHEASVYQVVDWKGQVYDAGEEPVPDGLDYEMWCGPAPKLPYRPGHWFRNFWDFNVGAVNGDIFHQADVARYMLNVTFPKSAYRSLGC